MTQHCALATDSTQEKTKDVARISTLHAPTSPPAEGWIILHVITFRLPTPHRLGTVIITIVVSGRSGTTRCLCTR